METKICSKCKKEKPISDFYKHGFNSKGQQTYRSDCKECQRKYDLGRKDVREDFVNKQKIKCAKCGETDKSRLHFHHKIPSEKEFVIGKMRNYSLEKFQKEIDKCVVLCASCHSTYHYLAEKTGITTEQFLMSSI